MKIVGIICEYNPFHLGHSRQLQLVRDQLGQDTGIVCVMSGNYVQRGLPAMWDKYVRARTAVSCGADLVVELPITRVLQSAEGFARGGVELLTRMGCAEYLCFGCEDPEIPFLELAQQMDNPDALKTLRKGLDQGLSYAAARQLALNDEAGILDKPNNILGFEYCRSIIAMQSHLIPLVIKRTGAYHAEAADPNAPSATAVRRLFPADGWETYVPDAAAAILSTVPWYDPSFGERAVLARLRALENDDWMQCAHGSEGLWSKAMKASRAMPDLESVIQATKSKRYPRSRIQRLLLCAYLGITAEDLHKPVPYFRALAASETGCRILRMTKKQGDFPVLNPGEHGDDPAYARLEARSTDLFTLFAAPNYPCKSGSEKQARIFIQKTQK